MTAAQGPTVSGRRSKAITRYRAVLMVSIVLNVAVGFFIMFAPGAFTALLHQPDAFPTAWPRHWGFQLLAINALYMPGFWDPVRHRWPNWCGIVIRGVFSLFFLSQGDGFVPMAIYDGTSGLALLLAYLPVVTSAQDIRTAS